MTSPRSISVAAFLILFNLVVVPVSSAQSNGTARRLASAIELTPLHVGGTVRDPNGSPVAGAEVHLLPPQSGTNLTDVKTDAKGRYQIDADIAMKPTPFLVIRDTDRNLAAARYLEEATNVYDFQLSPAWVISGRVQDEQGKPITNAELNVFIWSGDFGIGLYKLKYLPKADAHGRYEISALPSGWRYSVRATAKGYGHGSCKSEEPPTNRFEFEPIVLKLADKKIAGVVLDSAKKPAAGITVIAVDVEGVPSPSVLTDDRGQFTIPGLTEGIFRLSACDQKTPTIYGSARTEAGKTNVAIVLGDNKAWSEPYRASLLGSPLPDLTLAGIPAAAIQTNKPMLICLFDLEQRSSRRVVRLLGETNDSLKQKGITVVGISAALTTADALNEWKQSNPQPFPVGGVIEENDKTKWILNADKLPWLILTDTQNRVKAEGFAFEDLDAKLK